MRTSERLELKGVSVRYGGAHAVADVGLTVQRGQMVALLGPNGAGKSSLLRAVCGLAPVTQGQIRLGDRDITGWHTHRVTRSGVALVPEGRRVIGALTVEENLKVAGMAPGRSDRGGLLDDLAEVYSVFPKLRERSSQRSNLMSGGEQQMLAIARGMMARPDFLLIDEPSMGLAPIMVSEIYDNLKARRGRLADVGVLLTEQNAAVALPLVDHVYMLSSGRIVFEGPPGDVSEATTTAAYLGTAAPR